MRSKGFCIFSCALVFCLAGIFTNCNDKTPTGPLVAASGLEGAWTGHTTGDTSTYIITFTGNDFSFKSSAFSMTQNAYSGTVSIDSLASPKRFDAHIVDCAMNSLYVGKTSLCIYKISNDTLTYAGNEPGITLRPTSFAPTSQTAVFVLVRAR
jgi:uncharacterized protein (TIGR03067 family)